MPVESSGGPTILVPIEQAIGVAQRAFVAVGVPDMDARKAATALVDADLHGVSTHGIKNLRGYVRAVQSGRVNPRPQVRVTGGGDALLQMSGDRGLGHVTSYYGMEQAIAAATKYGIGCVFMRESSHYGASGYWARLPIAHGMAGFATTNAGASIAPWGGTVAMVGNNPPAWALPASFPRRPGLDARPASPAGASAGASVSASAGASADGLGGDSRDDPAAGSADGADAIFLDMALSVVAGNRLDIHARRGDSIPPGWAFDRDGQPTTDPRIRQQGGTFAPIAGYKGYGLALMLSLFTSLLAGGPFDYDVNRDDVPRAGRSHWFIAIDIARLVSLETFTERIEEISERIRHSPAKAGVERLYVPGDIERERARQQRRTGLALEPFIVDDLRALASAFDVPFEL